MSDDDYELSDEQQHDDEDNTGDSEGQDSQTSKVKASKSTVEPEDARSATAHNEVRQSLQSDVEAFLAKGGKIEQVDDNVMADPPRKPQSNYGSRPI